MCGLVGMVGKLNFKHEKILQTLLILDSLRGIDSTGVASVQKSGEIFMAKSVGNPFELFDNGKFKKAMNINSIAYIGHNRYATTGKVNTTNAHPYEFDTLVGAHNGTLKNKWNLHQGHSFDVDSQAFLNHIGEIGLKDALNKADGAWALTWWCKETDTMNFLRNKERPLFLTRAEGVVYWASEEWMLEVALGRHGVKDDGITLLPEDTHVSFKVEQDGSASKPVGTPAPGTYKGYSGNVFGGGTHNVINTTPPVNKVVAFTPRRVLAQDSNVRDEEYTFNITGEGVDSNNSFFYYLEDAITKNNIKYRLYWNTREKPLDTTRKVYAKVNKFVYSDRHGLYYKVVYSTVRVEPAQQDLLPKGTVIDSLSYDELDDLLKEGEPVFKDAKGNDITEESFMKHHGTCNFCEGNVNPAFGYKFTTNGDVICHECVADGEVNKYVQLS